MSDSCRIKQATATRVAARRAQIRSRREITSARRGGGSPEVRSSCASTRPASSVAASIDAMHCSSGTPTASMSTVQEGSDAEVFLQHPSAQLPGCPSSSRGASPSPDSQHELAQQAGAEDRAASPSSHRDCARIRFSQQQSDTHAAKATISTRCTSEVGRMGEDYSGSGSRPLQMRCDGRAAIRGYAPPRCRLLHPR